MADASAVTVGIVPGIARRLRLMRFLIRLVGCLALIVDGGLTATHAATSVMKRAPMDAGDWTVLVGFVLGGLIGIGLLVPAELARRMGSVWFLLMGALFGLGALFVASVMQSGVGSAPTGTAAFMMSAVYGAALHILFGAALLPSSAAFVCRYIGRHRITEASILDALHRAQADRSARMRRFATRELRQAAAVIADQGGTEGG